MRFGVCAGIESSVMLAEFGYDYIELGVASDLIPESGEQEWIDRRAQLASKPLVPETFCSFVRSGKIVGPEADAERLRRYTLVAADRAAQVGGQIIVFGSGGARSIPEAWPPDSARRQVMEFLGFCADAYDRFGVTVVIEPLSRAECNNINLVAEGAALARDLHRNGVRNLADTYHMEAEGEPLQEIVAGADVLAHVHTADSGRFAPGTGTYDHTAMFTVLACAGYEARVSIECSWQGRMAELAAPALAHLKAAYNGAKVP